MELTALDQATELLAKEREILILAPEKNSADTFCAMVGLSMALEKMGKQVKMISASHVPQALQFLPGTSQVQDYLEKTTDLVIDLPLNGIRPANITWKQVENSLRFVITPERGRTFSNPMPIAQSGLYPWKLIITVGAPELSALGKPFTEHASYFYETPILNIDHGTANDFFGAVNLVTATTGTVSEVVYELINTIGGVNIITPEVATVLFAGILAGTRSFHSPITTPRTFTIASELLEQEADRQTVTRNLFKTHKLPELRLMGRSLARLHEISENVFWSVVLQKDFEDSGAKPDDLPIILQEITERAGENTPIVLVFERTSGTMEALIFPGRISKEDREKLREKLNGTIAGHFVLVALGKINLTDLEKNIRDIILPQLPTIQ
jgi:nanoRNase/pAp phosphatase (c-di-AMP/oligoRNAs hydrolase)